MRIFPAFRFFSTLAWSLAGLSLCTVVRAQGIYINEFQAANIATVRNPHTNSFDDWIELHNTGATAVNLRGYFLTDNPDNPEKWEIPMDALIPADGYLLVWANGAGEGLQANFSLSRSGEFVGLYDSAGTVIDSLSFGMQQDDISYGRLPGDPHTWAFFDAPTPGSANPAEPYGGRAESAVFSLPGGFYSGPQTLHLSHPDPGAEIRYTLDGTPPGPGSARYSAPLTFTATTALRVRAYVPGKEPGEVITQTYFIDETVHLPFVSLVTDPAHLFSDETGIYVIGTNGVKGYCAQTPMNVNQDWERPVNVEIYDTDGTAEINQQAGVKIFGGCSRTRYPQKSLELFARRIYGKGSFEARLFKDKPIQSFESFILRASGDDVTFTMMKDGLGQTMLDGMDIDRQAYRPTVVFINGQYWGIHNLREKISEHYVAGNYGIDAEEVDLLKRNPASAHNVVSGSAEHYNRFLSWVSSRNMQEEGTYEYIERNIDVRNYIDYYIAEIYLSANDWPGNNIKFWRANSGPLDRWRWIIYDLDNCFFYIDRNTLELATNPDCGCGWPNPPWSTLLFRRLLENPRFRDEFIQRYAWHMNTTFQPARVNRYIDSLKANIAPEIPRHIGRWGGQKVPNPESWIRPIFNSVAEWEGHINGMRNFIARRRQPATQHVLSYFGLSGTANITVQSAQPGMGAIKITDQSIGNGPHQGDYFMGIPLLLRAIPASGYRFSHWQYSSASGSRRLSEAAPVLVPTENFTLTAHFTAAPGPDPALVINEINYHSPEAKNAGDWVELYNPKSDIVDLTDWTLLDEDDGHVFAFSDGQEIGPNGFLVVCEDISAFRAVHPEVTNAIGNLGYGLSNNGELIRLYGPGRVLADSVRYGDAAPWPEAADGKGPTLELIDPALDNYLPESWQASQTGGTPGKPNFPAIADGQVLGQNYPNPADVSTTIPFSLNSAGFVEIRLYNLLGEQVALLLQGRREAADFQLELDTTLLPPGLYLYVLTIDGNPTGVRKMVITRQ
jgi:hypothetical protein